MARQKRQPQRTCVVCREAKDKRELIRIVRTPEGKVVLDPTGKANGRGAYLCRQTDCLEKGLRKGRLAQALKITLSTEDGATLETSLQTELAKI
jgi:predicted RNA-binding protein YlxR (DUF448 family)